MAPEQLRDAKKVDGRADVWSLGLTLYSALSARVPFAELEGYTAIALAVHQGAIPSVQEGAPWLDPGLAQVVHGAVVQRVERRCPSLAALADALLPYTAGNDCVRADQLVGVELELTRTERERLDRPGRWAMEPPRYEVPDPDDKAPDLLVGCSVGERYKITRLIGRGGVGSVYEAQHSDGQRVALKLIEIEGEGESCDGASRVVREARMLIGADDDHLARVIDVGVDPKRGQPFIVMDLLPGSDLRCYINEHGALDPRAAARFFVAACRGLARAHAMGLVHGNVKPANLFVYQHVDGRLIAKLCDFGVASCVSVNRNDATVVAPAVRGSPLYMSPEQLEDAGCIDARSDIWSMGIALYEALSGATPWSTHDTVGEVVAAIGGEVAPLRDKAPWIESGLAAVVHKALARDPNERFPSADALADALEIFASKRLKRHRFVAVGRRVRHRATSLAATSLAATSRATKSRGATSGLESPHDIIDDDTSVPTDSAIVAPTEELGQGLPRSYGHLMAVVGSVFLGAAVSYLLLGVAGC